MKANKLPQSLWNDEQATGSQSQPVNQSNTPYLTRDKTQQTGCASNDKNYVSEDLHHPAEHLYLRDTHAAYNSLECSVIKTKESAMNIESPHTSNSNINSDYKKAITEIKSTPVDEQIQKDQEGFLQDQSKPYELESYKTKAPKTKLDNNQNISLATTHDNATKIPERVFMKGLVKHTAIALAIIIPLAAFSAYADAAPQVLPANTTPAQANLNKTAALAVEPAAIIHKSANTPTTVDNVDLKRYAGKWYEIGRLPMYFQRNCARDVTATYTGKSDGSGITVLNQCVGAEGIGIKAEGLAKPADNTGSKLKVSFLPSWIRWLPVGRADYWVLARDGDYQTALIGTPDKDYL